MSSYNPNIDLTGKLIIKVRLGDDIRRIPIHNDDLTYDELMLMMQRIYSDKLSSKDDITLKYKDEDGDLITLFDSSDLTFATQCSRILKLTLFVNGQPRPLENDEIKYVKKELQEMRDRVTHLLDRLEPQWDAGCTNNIPIIKDGSKVSESRSETVTQTSASPSIRVAQGKEFDPLSSQRSVEDNTQKVMSSFGLSNDAVADRSGTPDSLSSANSSTGNQYRVQHASTQQTQPQHPQQFSSSQAHPPHLSQTQVTSQQTAFQGQQPQPQPQPQPQLQSPAQPQMTVTGQQLAKQQLQQQQHQQPGQQQQQQQPGQQQQQPAGQGFQLYNQPQRFPIPAATRQPVASQPAAPQPGQSQTVPAQHQVQPQQGGGPAGFNPQYGIPNPQQPQAQPQMFQQNPAQSQSYSGYVQPGASGSGDSVSPVQQSGNPYARGPGSGYAGYPRPAGNYPQAGYQQQ